MAKASPIKSPTDVEFLTDPMNWPKWPVLPLVHRTKNDRGSSGFVHGSEPLKVYFGIVFEITEKAKTIEPETGREHVTWAQVLALYESRTFDSPEQLLAEYRID